MKSVVAENLVKTYRKGAVRALDDLSLDVEEGTVLGVLGPNGAGKTTTVRVLSTLLEPDSGHATVGGIDVLKNPKAVRQIIGLSGQYAAVDETLTGWDNLVMFGQLYHLSGAQSRTRATELLDQFALSEAARRPIKTFSGGMRRRLDLAASLIIRPKVLFLDEPTTGLDPRGRMEMWGVIEGLVREGVTLLLTTQYLEEADQLADDIVVIDQGKVIACGTSDQLKDQVGGGARKISVPVQDGTQSLIAVIREFDSAGIHALDLALKRPSLDDVFLSLTGHIAQAEVVESSAKKTKKKRGSEK
jgi:ABC-2 type transport system ATP-binding protein